MASDRISQIHKLIWAYVEKRDEQSRKILESAIESIPEKDVVEVLSYGYYYNIFAKYWHYIKILFAWLFGRYNSDQRRTVFHYAVHCGHAEVMELILEIVGPDVVYSLLKKQTNWNQCTAVHYAAEKDFASTLQLMRTALQSDRTWLDIISIQDHGGRTAVHAAAVKSKSDAINEMLSDLEQKNQVLEIQDNKGNTALHLAAKVADSDTMRALTRELDKTEMYDLLTIQSKSCLNTTIHLIAKYGNETDFLCLILQLGEAQVEAVLTIPNANGDTAEQIARDRKKITLANEMQSQLRKAKKKNCSKKGRTTLNSNSVAIDMLPSSVAGPISRRDYYSARYNITSAIVENKVEITGISHQSNHSGNTQLEDITEPGPGGNIHPEEET